MSRETFWEYYWAGADGFNIEDEAIEAEECALFGQTTALRLGSSFSNFTNGGGWD
jgi:hypothetical protein